MQGQVSRCHPNLFEMVLFHCFEQAAVQYLFPSGIYDRKARPFMKPPEEVYPPRKRIQFDKTGRPFHYMFFTGFPHYYNLCHVSYRNILNRLHGICNVSTIYLC